MVDRIQYCTIMMMIVRLTDLIFKTNQDLYKNDKNYEFFLGTTTEKKNDPISCHVSGDITGMFSQQKPGFFFMV